MTTNHIIHPLAEPITNVRGYSDLVEDNVFAYLQVLYAGKLYETLTKDYLDKRIILNLIDAYSVLSEIIFWEENEYYAESLSAFPLLVKHILVVDLDIKDLCGVSNIISNFYEEGDEAQHLEGLKGAVEELTTVFQQEKNKSQIYAALSDKSRSDYCDLISTACDFYGEDVFELFFSYVLHQPVKVLFWSYWILEMSSSQCQRFIEWARSFMPVDCLGKVVSRTQNYNETEKAILERVLSYPEHTLRNRQDQLDFLTWGLSSTHQFLPCTAAWVLEDIPVSDWPNGSVEIIAELYDAMEPNWTTWINREARYVTIKERLAGLLERV